MEQKIINICIDDVIRDYSNTFIYLYEQTYPDRDKITDLNPYDINRYFFNKKEEEEFLHLENQFELLGMATECYQGCSQDYNKVKQFLNGILTFLNGIFYYSFTFLKKKTRNCFYASCS